MKKVKLSEDVIGETLAMGTVVHSDNPENEYEDPETIFDLQLKEGTEVTQDKLESLEDFGFQTIYVESQNHDEYRDYLYDENIALAQNEIVTELKKIENKIRNEEQFELDQLKSNLKLLIKTTQFSTQSVAYTSLKSKHDYLAKHSFDVARLALNFMQQNKVLVRDVHSRELEEDSKTYTMENEVEDLALSALLHDLGKQLINDEILSKPDDLNETEWQKVKQHPILTVKLLKSRCKDNLTKTVLQSIYDHCESFNGSGYPNQKEEYESFVFARVLRLCDVYSALTSDRPYRMSFSPHRARQVMYSIQDNNVFDPEFFELFMEMVPPFPIGLQVELSNGEKAVIHDYDDDDKHNPIVKTENNVKMMVGDSNNPNIIS